MSSRSMRQRPALMIGLLCSIITGAMLVSLGTFVIGPHVRSPEQAAADAAPPPPSSVTVEAEVRDLVESVVLRGQVRPGASVPLLPPMGAVGEDSVVTAVLLKEGETLEEGEVVIERSGESMTALALPFPLYRDIVGGDSGPDVSELQKALQRLGYAAPGSGVLDAATQSVLVEFYRDRGYEPVAGNPEAASQLSAAEDAVGEAEHGVSAAGEAGERAIAEAERELEAALSAVSAVEAADELAEARARAEEAEEALKAAEEFAEEEMERAVGALEKARKELDGLRLAAGPGVRRSSVLLLDTSGRVVSKINIEVGDRLTDAEAPLVELDGEASFLLAFASRQQAQLLMTGQAATVFDDATETQMEATITDVGTEVVESDIGGTGFEVKVALTDSAVDLPEGRSMRIDVAVEASDRPSLAVPVTAIYSEPDGSTYVTVMGPDGETADVAVATGRTAGGWVAVSPSPPDALTAGTPVVVGTEVLN